MKRTREKVDDKKRKREVAFQENERENRVKEKEENEIIRIEEMEIEMKESGE